MKRRSVVVTGTGLICAAGCGVAATWRSLLEGRSGLRPLSLFASPRYGHHPVGQVGTDLGRLTRGMRGSRTDRLAWVALQEALASAGLTSGDELPEAERRGVFFGGTVGGMNGTERWLERHLLHRPDHAGLLRFHECATTADLCAARVGAQGPVITFSTACSAAAMAIAAAARAIQNDEIDLALVGGADALCRLTLNGFGSLLLLDPAGCRPFDAHRAGISLGEGAAFLVLESAETAAARSAPALAFVSGWGLGCDAHHPTSPHPEGLGAFAAIHQACDHAGLGPADIDFVCAHGTGTPDNDAMESRALRELFRDAVPPVASLMRLTGHTLGASGAMKVVLGLEALRAQILPPSLGCTTPDPGLGIRSIPRAQPHRIRHFLSNSFGFGGNNVALVFSQTEATPAPPLVNDACGPLAVVGAGVVSAAGIGVAEVIASCLHPQTAATTGSPAPVSATQASAAFSHDPALDPARRRRVGRLQQMTLAAARQAWPAAGLPAGDRIAIALGTGLGCLNETAAFLENMILKEERAPRPAHFTNSVHNALASQVALEWRCTGLNATTTQHDISFEAALWQASQELRSRRADLALAGAADELNPHLLALGQRWGWWPSNPQEQALPNRCPQLPGEAATAFTLARESTAIASLARLLTVRLRHRPQAQAGSPASWSRSTDSHEPTDPRVKAGDPDPSCVSNCTTSNAGEHLRHRLDPAAEAAWIAQVLQDAGVPLRSLALLLIGGSHQLPIEMLQTGIADELSRLARIPIRCATYHHLCGDFHAASGFGFLLALLVARGELRPDHLLTPGPGFTPPPSPAAVDESFLSGAVAPLAATAPGPVALLTLSLHGSSALCCVDAPAAITSSR